MSAHRIERALSIRAPWWWAILHGKPVENRDWNTNFRGPVWLHASKHWKLSEIEDDLETIAYMSEEDGLQMPAPGLELMRSMGGCIVGSVVITDCVKEHSSAFFQGEYGFVLTNPIPLEAPVPCKGSLGFFHVPESLLGDAV